MDKARQKLRNCWAKKFPAMSKEWSYWWIEGDGFCLAIIDGSNLTAAIEIVEDNWERFASIKAYKAKHLDKDLVRREKNNYEISNQEYSKQALENFNKEYKCGSESDFIS